MAGNDTSTNQDRSSELLAPLKNKGEVCFLKNRFRIYPELPLLSLDMPCAKAFQAEETSVSDRKVFALVCRPDLPVRKDHIKSRSGLEMEGILTLVDAGIAFWEPFKSKTMILIYELPLGGRVVQSGTYDKVLPEEETEKISRWIRPLLMGINNLSLQGLTHREIRPDNLFYLDAEKTKVVWGDCISSPAGYDQPSCFETIESSMCSAAGKGNGVTADDLYAFGATLVCLGLGYNPVEHLSDDELLTLKIYKGSYAALIGEERIPLALIELLRGLLADNVSQRWDISSTQLWADGRRLTPIQSKSFNSSQRPFLFNNVEYFSYRTLAYAFSKNWDLASDAIRSEKLLTWVVRGFDDKTTAEAITASINMALERFSIKEKQDDFIIARTCMLLDSNAPLRMRECSFMPDALGTMLALYAHDEKMTKTLIGVVAAGYLESWYEFHHDRISAQYIKNMQVVLQKPDLGMGAERLLYDLNDNLACQSPLVIKDYVDDIKDLMPALEKTAKTVSYETYPLDRHIAAFIAVKFGLRSAEALTLLNSRKEYVSMQGMLNIFSALQSAFGPQKLYAFCGWIGKWLSPIVKSYHSIEKRMILEKNLPQLLKKGSLPDICAFLDDKQERLLDTNYFEQAKKEYARLSGEIELLSEKSEKRKSENMILGYQIAAVFCFGTAVLMMSFLLLSEFF